jgi:hypothetical protein
MIRNSRSGRDLHDEQAALEHVMPDLDDCIDACDDCASICLEMLAQHCLPTGGRYAEPFHIVAMLDCIDMCRTAADFMRRRSPLHARVCRLCADVCDICAESCEALEGMEECAETCRDCSDSCRQMAQHVVDA